MSGAAVTLADVRAIDLFDDLDDAQLGEWLAAALPRTAEPGEILAEQGEPTPVFLLFEGTLQTWLVHDEHVEPVGRQYPPTWLGAIGALSDSTLGVRVTAETVIRYGIVAAAEFRRLAFAHESVHRRVMQQVAPVMSRITAIEQNRERLASLGTMAAGLAHELNNPAAAAGRARRAAGRGRGRRRLDARPLRRVGDRAGGCREAARPASRGDRARRARTALDALDAADAEDALLERLEALGIPEPWRLAEPLAAAGVDERLAGAGRDARRARDRRRARVGRRRRSRRAASRPSCRSRRARMSSLVGAVKSYAYMDRGDLVEVDLHEGLETTLARARPPAQAHRDPGRARLRPQPAAS